MRGFVWWLCDSWFSPFSFGSTNFFFQLFKAICVRDYIIIPPFLCVLLADPHQDSSLDVIKVSTISSGGIAGSFWPTGACSVAKWNKALYFHNVQGWPERPGRQIGQWIGTLVQGDALVHFRAHAYTIFEYWYRQLDEIECEFPFFVNCTLHPSLPHHPHGSTPICMPGLSTSNPSFAHNAKRICFPTWFHMFLSLVDCVQKWHCTSSSADNVSTVRCAGRSVICKHSLPSIKLFEALYNSQRVDKHI